MARSNLASQIGLTRGKAILVGVLAVIFVGVIISNVMSDPAASRGDTEQSANKRRPVRQVKTPTTRTHATRTYATVSNESDQADLDFRPWPAINVKKATKHDPLAMPESLLPDPPKPVQPNIVQVKDEIEQAQKREEKRLQQMQALQRLQQAGVEFVVVSENSKIAKIGQRRITTGDLIDGFRIIEIRDDGSIVVKEASE